VRWRLLARLSDGATRCVCDLQPAAAVAANLLSYHLRVLREAGLIEGDRRGTWIYYRAVPTALAAASDALAPTRVPA